MTVAVFQVDALQLEIRPPLLQFYAIVLQDMCTSRKRAFFESLALEWHAETERRIIEKPPTFQRKTLQIPDKSRKIEKIRRIHRTDGAILHNSRFSALSLFLFALYIYTGARERKRRFINATPDAAFSRRPCAFVRRAASKEKR